MLLIPKNLTAAELGEKQIIHYLAGDVIRGWTSIK